MGCRCFIRRDLRLYQQPDRTEEHLPATIPVTERYSLTSAATGNPIIGAHDYGLVTADWAIGRAKWRLHGERLPVGTFSVTCSKRA